MSATRIYLLCLALAAFELLAGLRGVAQTRSELYYTGTMAGQPIQTDLTFAAPAHFRGAVARDRWAGEHREGNAPARRHGHLR